MEIKERMRLFRAFQAKDRRYDGRFFIGVFTTGIYCRPICPAKPKFENIRFYKSKAEAELAGYRPCLRCRPDLSPLSPQWEGTAAIMNRAIHLIENESGKSLESLAESLGMTDRHLRRLFNEHLGVSPIHLALSKRLHLARQLLSQTNLPVTEVAYASGFKSIRRFNDAFVKLYQKSPRSFRKEENLESPSSVAPIRLELSYSPPFDWETLLAFFKRHEVFGIEQVGDQSYERHFFVDNLVQRYLIAHDPKKLCFKIELNLTRLSYMKEVIEKIRLQLDLAHNPYVIQTSGIHPIVRKEIKQVRIPGAFDTFETAVTIILGQLVTTEHALENVKKLVMKYGEKITSPWSQNPVYRFPQPETLAVADLSSLGFTKIRSEAIRLLSQAVFRGEIDLSPGCDLLRTREKLLSIKGIGPWTASLIALRCLGDSDSFPEGDLIIRRAIDKFEMNSDLCSPWRGYLSLAIWKTQAHLLTNKREKK